MARESLGEASKSPRVRWGREEGAQAVEAWRSSGEQLQVYCGRLGLKAERLEYWAKKLSQQRKSKQGPNKTVGRGMEQRPVSFLPVVVREAKSVVERLASEAVSPEWAARFVRALFRGEQ